MQDSPHMPGKSPGGTGDAAPRLSVIVPLAPNETAWHGLLEQLATLPNDCEVILVQADTQNLSAPKSWPSDLDLRTCRAPSGRARQQNVGVQAARGRWLWFLHADSGFTPSTVPALQRFIAVDTDALGYFNLSFDRDGPRLAALNAWGANLRSRWFGLPFGDQGLLLPAARFARLGGFDENAAFGEDHLLVWTAHQAGLPVRCLGASLRTSARKYARDGWLRTTLRHWRLTVAQAWPAWRRVRRNPQ